ncbi:hypothetical protein AB833_10110 [Chromatiales bacterium (ex Bugula neritina AB1)]|nr:hypothetical protein AB833_10110 [Chromatiales bacterium (ex Bugula neritina AB1)]
MICTGCSDKFSPAIRKSQTKAAKLRLHPLFSLQIMSNTGAAPAILRLINGTGSQKIEPPQAQSENNSLDTQ